MTAQRRSRPTITLAALICCGLVTLTCSDSGKDTGDGQAAATDGPVTATDGAVPDIAKAGGFDAPILHGLATLGVAGHAILKTMCAYDPARFKSLDLRFSAPVYPGETIRTEMWRDDGVVSFRARVVERDVVVLNNGRAEVTD